jgi:hypothetical protein
VVEAIDLVEVGHIGADYTAGIAEKMDIAGEKVGIAGLVQPAA